MAERDIRRRGRKSKEDNSDANRKGMESSLAIVNYSSLPP